MRHILSSTMSWLEHLIMADCSTTWIIVILCFVGLLKEFRPSESYLIEYAVDHQNFTAPQVTYNNALSRSVFLWTPSRKIWTKCHCFHSVDAPWCTSSHNLWLHCMDGTTTFDHWCSALQTCDCRGNDLICHHMGSHHFSVQNCFPSASELVKNRL